MEFFRRNTDIYSDSGKNQAENLLGRISRGFQASANPNTVVKALSMLCDEGIIYPKSTAGNFVTEDKSILDAAREAEAVRITEGDANAIAQLGFDREKTEALLEKYLRKDEANGNNT